MNSDLSHYSCDSYIETQKRKKRNRKTEYENKTWKQNAKNCQKAKSVFVFLQNENQSGSGDVVFPSKQKNFSCCKKKMFWAWVAKAAPLGPLEKKLFFHFSISGIPLTTKWYWSPAKNFIWYPLWSHISTTDIKGCSQKKSKTEQILAEIGS